MRGLIAVRAVLIGHYSPVTRVISRPALLLCFAGRPTHTGKGRALKDGHLSSGGQKRGN